MHTDRKLYLLAEGEQKALKDKDGPSATQDGERLPSKQAEKCTSEGSTQEAFQDTLDHMRKHMALLG